MTTRTSEELDGALYKEIVFCIANQFRSRTGVVLPEKKRDEHGIEEITGLFSSPRKPSPPKVNGVDGASGNADFHNTTIEVSEDMVGMDSTSGTRN